MTDNTDAKFLEAWTTRMNTETTVRMYNAGGLVLHALAALDAALGHPEDGSTERATHPGSAEPLARLIVHYYGEVYAHDVVAPDIQNIAHWSGE
jgi:hypothetical protein